LSLEPGLPKLSMREAAGRTGIDGSLQASMG
jgi:hypothetical protein